jgi:hypothetical protein
MFPYPYFFLGFSFPIQDLDPEDLTKKLSDLSLFRRFTFEEASVAPTEDEVKSISIICGTPKEIVVGEPLTVCEYRPILLEDFISCGGQVLTQADLSDKNNLKIYMNGEIAVEDEDYTLDIKNKKINILWDLVKDTDIFSYSIPFKNKETRYEH